VFTPPDPGRLEVDTCGTNDLGGVDTGMDTVLSLHTGAPGTVDNEVTCNDDWFFGGSPPDQCASSDLNFPVDSATSFEVPSIEPVWIRVATFLSSRTDEFLLNVRFVPEPSSGAMVAGGVAGLSLAGSRRRRSRRLSETVRAVSG
jgi:hypothetical protein